MSEYGGYGGDGGGGDGGGYGGYDNNNNNGGGGGGDYGASNNGGYGGGDGGGGFQSSSQGSQGSPSKVRHIYLRYFTLGKCSLVVVRALTTLFLLSHSPRRNRTPHNREKAAAPPPAPLHNL